MGKVRTIPRNGLVGEWLLDGNANDTSGNAYNGTAYNATWNDTDKGYQYKKLTCNGSSTYISGTGTFPTGTSVRTVSFWFYPNTVTSNNHVFLGYGNRSSNQWFGIYANSSGIGLSQYGSSSSVVAIDWNKRHFGVTTYDGSHRKLYLDNNPTPIIDWTRAIDTSGTGYQIGGYSGEYFSGDIQDVRVYNRVITTQEIQTLYMEGLKKLGGESYVPLLDGLVGYRDLDGNANDTVGGYDGTTTGTITYLTNATTNSGLSLCAYNTAAAPSSYLTTTLSSQFKSVSMWFKGLTSTGTGDNTAEWGDLFNETSNGSSGLLIRRGGNTNNLYYYIGGDLYWNNNINNGLFDNTWHHIALTTDGTNTYLYTDGALTYTKTSTTRTGTGVVHICGTPYGNRHFGGYLSDVMVFSTQKTADEVKEIYDLQKVKKILPF